MALFSFQRNAKKADSPSADVATDHKPTPPVAPSAPPAPVKVATTVQPTGVPAAAAPAPASSPSPAPAAAAPGAAAVQKATAGQPAAGTETKQVDDRLLYRALMESLYDGILVVSSSGHIIDVNSRAYRLLGYDSGYLWHVPVATIVPSMTAEIINQIRFHTEADRFTVLNAICTRKDGTTFHAEIAIRSTRLINMNDMVFCIRDVEKQRLGKERHQNELQAVRGNAAGLLVCDAGGVIQYANAAFAILTGLENESAAAGRPLTDFLPSTDDADNLLAFAVEHGSCTAERLAKDAAGGDVPVIVTVSYQDGGGPELSSAVVTLISTSGLRTAAVRLREAPAA